MERDESMIAALRRERAAYAARGDADRVAQVDEQLRHHGAEPEVAAAAQADSGPQGREGPAARQDTAGGDPSGARARPASRRKPASAGD